MTSDPRLVRRVTRLENDVASIYEILTGHSRILDEHSRTLDEHSRTLAEHSRTLAEHSRILADHTRILTEHTGRFDRIDGTLAEVLRRLPEPA